MNKFLFLIVCKVKTLKKHNNYELIKLLFQLHFNLSKIAINMMVICIILGYNLYNRGVCIDNLALQLLYFRRKKVTSYNFLNKKNTNLFGY